MTIRPYLSFPGYSGEVIAYYEKIFDVKAEILNYDDLPEGEGSEMHEEMQGLVMHSDMEIAGSRVMISDDPYKKEVKDSNISLGIFLDDQEKLREYYEKLSEGGEIIMPLEKTFWSELFGIVKDKYGTEWLFDYESE
ncbi:MAG: VOC family protein [Gallicola sp.]|nr:VOC family protein [Gallicola sp.]